MHFTALVITHSGTEEEAEGLLRKFDENTEVEPYTEPCWCVGQAAKKEIQKLLSVERPVEKAREDFRNRDDVKELSKGLAFGIDGFSEEMEALWMDFYVNPFMQREQTLLALHPDGKAPDPNCDDCNGTGVTTTTYNPHSKWDWYELGGGWHELFQPFQGKSLTEFNAYRDEDGQPLRTYAIVTPDGEWLEKGQHGWWASVNEKSKDEWEACFQATLDKYPDHKVLVFDCHI